MTTGMHATAGELEELGRSGFALAMQLLRNRDDAADAVQDALHTVWRKRRAFDPRRGELRVWFLKIVRNRCLDLLRGRRRDSAAAIDWQTLPAADQPSPDVAAQNQELIKLLKRELMAMPQDQREIVLLRDYHNLSYAQVAEILAIPAGTVMSRLHRARKELRRRMQKYG